MSSTLELVIGWLYPRLMSTYGDRGNVITIERRAQWRGYNVRVVPLDQNSTAADIRSVDIIVGGGAQDRQQEIVMRDLQGAKAEAMGDKIHNGTPGVFTCGSPQLLGKYYEPALGKRIEGLGIFDLVSVHPGENTQRCIGNLVVEVTANRLGRELAEMTGTKPYLVGFENHGGRTRLGEVEALGRVVYGLGNNGEDGTEGAFYQNAIATYSHGPLLPKNPFVADWLIQTALRLKYQQAIALSPLDDSLALQARSAMLKRLNLSLTHSV
ncbi:type 1 glutamine amidotransferase [Anabaenopsis sp. FSS-46]|uniref:type 1 glutamine amidotransferase n=1 Tax=Anabaenopsis sp. FSS-46 TaxID=2971766 RepID=UPI002473DFDD|nr:type 1 glutamine amidotransferase [Anabaenopsis sp. FSS-46]MDH6099529.1 type 1 glutamine amidotransferase [Anabaenopsis sp. FSS-46]